MFGRHAPVAAIQGPIPSSCLRDPWSTRSAMPECNSCGSCRLFLLETKCCAAARTHQWAHDRMACMIRIDGRHLDVDAFLRRSPLEPSRVFRRGVKDYSTGPASRRSGFTFVISNRQRSNFKGQIRETIAFLTEWMRELRRVRRFPGVEGAVLDFGVEWKADAAIQWSHLPEQLVRLAAQAALALEVTVYPTGEPSRPRRAPGAKRVRHRRTTALAPSAVGRPA